ncbi:MAG: SHOCT domain-containing protein [Clostridia bacterium]|nr:SHOCT domain-containing protein [Clostridia bacterium]
MKTASKVFVIISIVSGFILCLLASIFLIVGIANDGFEAGIVLFVIYGILGGLFVGLGFKALKLINNAKRADDISTGWKVVILLFVNTVAGILLLCMKDADFDPQLAQPQRQTVQPNADLERIAKLKAMLDDGIITQEEYDRQKDRILNDRPF